MSVILLDPIPAPLPGDAATVGAKAADLSATAQALRDAITELKALANDDVIISEAVEEVRVKADDVRTAISKVEDRYQGAATAMYSFKNGLSSAQTRADAARQRVTDNNSDASYWRKRLNALTLQAESGESSKELLDDLLEAKSHVATFATEFTSAMAEYNAAEQDRIAAVDTAIAALQDAADTAGLNDGFWDYVGLGLEVMYEWAQENLTPILEAIRSIAELLKSIVDILSLIVTILAIFLPFLAPLAAALTLASLALSAIILLSSLLLFALGKESLGRVLGDAIGLATSIITSKMGGLKIFSPGAKLAGLSSVFTRSAWSSGVSTMKLGFAFSSAVVGTSETVAGAGLDIAAKLFDPAKMSIKLGSGIISELTKGGLDIQLDFFPEGGNGGMAGPFEGGWDLNTEELGNAIIKPLANAATGGISNTVVSVIRNVDAVFGAS